MKKKDRKVPPQKPKKMDCWCIEKNEESLNNMVRRKSKSRRLPNLKGSHSAAWNL